MARREHLIGLQEELIINFRRVLPGTFDRLRIRADKKGNTLGCQLRTIGQQIVEFGANSTILRDYIANVNDISPDKSLPFSDSQQLKYWQLEAMGGDSSVELERSDVLGSDDLVWQGPLELGANNIHGYVVKSAGRIHIFKAADIEGLVNNIKRSTVTFLTKPKDKEPERFTFDLVIADIKPINITPTPVVIEAEEIFKTKTKNQG